MSEVETGGTPQVRPDEAHDRITQAYLGELGQLMMRNSQRRIHWICERVRGRRVLDIGCSQGIACILLAREGCEVTGIDLDIKAIDEARAYLAAEPPEVQDRVRFLHGDAAALAVEEPFDTVLLTEILEHFEDPAWLIDVAARQMTAEGRLVVTVPFGINDFIDHKQTFYLSGPYELISKKLNIVEFEILGKWIGFTADGPSHSEDLAGQFPESSMIPMLEASFQLIERDLLTGKKTAGEHLAKARKQIDQLTHQLRNAEEERDGQKVEADRIERRLRVAEEERDGRKAEADRLEHRLRIAEEEGAAAAESAMTEHRRFEVELRHKSRQAKERATTIRDLRKGLRKTRESTSFRLGHSIVRGVRYPGRLLKLPATAWRLWRADGSDGQVAPIPTPSEMSLDEMFRFHAANGIEGLSEEIMIRTPQKSRAAAAMIRAGKALAAAGVPEAEKPLALDAVRLNESVDNLRALYWVAQRTEDLATAKDCLTRIERIYGQDPSPSQVADLEKLRKGPAFQLSILDQVRPAGPRSFEPVPGRLVYMLHNSLPWSSGGYATRTHGMALGMAAAGLDVICMTRPGFPLDTKSELDPCAIPEEDVIEGIAYRRLAAPLRTNMLVQDYMRAAADVLEIEFQRLRPEWVIAASNHYTGLPALIAARRLGIPFVYEVRGFWEITRLSREPEFGQKAAFRVQELLEGGTAERADHVFTLTGPMRDELVRRGVSRDTIMILPNSVDPDRFAPCDRDADLATRLDIPADVPVIGYIGTFVQYEGLDDLVAACAILRARGRTFRLMLVGNENASGQDKGPITETVERMAAESGLADWLIMPGRVPHEEVEAYYSLIDIAPFPRKPQPVTEMVSPIKPLEALAMEKAVVVSSVRALIEMIADDETGLVFTKGDVESLADTLDRLIGDPALRARLARAGRDWVVRERTWKEMGARVAERLATLRDAKIAGGYQTTEEHADAVKE